MTTEKPERRVLKANQYAHFRHEIEHDKDLTGYTARMMVKHRYWDNIPYVLLTTENGKIELEGTTIRITALPEDILRLARGRQINRRYTDFEYDLVLIDPTGFTEVPYRGPFRVYPGVTRRI